ncbi:MAG TPA: hypothetical protein PLK40_07280 [Bacteroidaceae bacterium]|mgnify:CR=1 FL=1|nr:hypothetical protein [Bacteroidaceae bacterium]
MTTKETPFDELALTADIIQTYTAYGPQAIIYLGLTTPKKEAWIQQKHPEIIQPDPTAHLDFLSFPYIKLENCLYIANEFFGILINVLVDDGLWDVDPQKDFTRVKQRCQATIDKVCADNNTLSHPLSITYDWLRPWIENEKYDRETQADFLQQFKTDFFESDFQNADNLFHQSQQTANDYICNAQLNDEIKVHLFRRNLIIIDILGDDYKQIAALTQALKGSYRIKVYFLDMLYDDNDATSDALVQKIRKNWKRLRKAYSLIGIHEARCYEWLAGENDHYRIRK